MAELTPELFQTHLAIFKKEDLQKKMHIAANVKKRFELKCERKDNLLTTCQSITGVPQETLSIVQNLESKSVKFDEWLSEQKQMLHAYNYEYTSIRKLLLKNYTQLHEIPTGIKNNKDYVGYKKFFTLVQIPGTEASIIVEKPETVIERHRFLRTKMTYREQNKNIVYVGKINLIMNHGKFSYKEDNVELKSRFIIAASPTFGHVGYIYCCGNSQEYMTNWLEEKIIPELPEESVIIFQENVLDKFDDSIVDDLSKEDIINWLESNNIKHDPKIHRADLYKLVNTFKQSHIKPLSSAELCLRAKGHITIRKKGCNLNNNYFDPFWDFFVHELNQSNEMQFVRANDKIHLQAVTIITKLANRIVQNVPLDYWNNLDNILFEKEKHIYREDLEIEHVIDKLMTMVKNEGIPKEWKTQGVKLDHYNKSTEQTFMILSKNLLQLYEKVNKTQYYKTLNIFK